MRSCAISLCKMYSPHFKPLASGHHDASLPQCADCTRAAVENEGSGTPSGDPVPASGGGGDAAPPPAGTPDDEGSQDGVESEGEGSEGPTSAEEGSGAHGIVAQGAAAVAAAAAVLAALA